MPSPRVRARPVGWAKARSAVPMRRGAGWRARISRVLALQQPVGRDLAAEPTRLGLLVGEAAERSELDAEPHHVDEAGERAGGGGLDLAGDELAEIGQLLEVDADAPRAAHLFELVREPVLRIVVVDRLLALADDVVGGPADAGVHHVERASLEYAVAELQLLDAGHVRVR